MNFTESIAVTLDLYIKPDCACLISDEKLSLRCECVNKPEK